MEMKEFKHCTDDELIHGWIDTVRTDRSESADSSPGLAGRSLLPADEFLQFVLIHAGRIAHRLQ